ncbi:hypothetical protein CYMTET_30069 [Cymbomonas tetramitiformis]|uniref:Uncharacterized protein n=1 Tax=Cymbomonas tetramitiformis TaxID=36881 RepID=A0AAE0FJQ8_9CHLO|nr:hypothetical protein CYMTET_30069 [Cymbomonas tetramitiformis]
MRVRDSPTPCTPKLAPTPAAALGTDTAAVRATRATYEEIAKKVADIYANGRHQKWAKAMRRHVLGGNDKCLEADDAADTDKLAKLAVSLKTEILSAGLDDVDVFDFEDAPYAGRARGHQQTGL